MMTRKQFLRSALELSAATLGLTVLYGCTGSRMPSPDGGGVGAPDAQNGGGGGGGGTPSRCTQDGTRTTIGENHGHVMVVSKDEVAAAIAKTYHIQGAATHDHTVDLSADDYISLQNDRAIMTTSSFDASHSHSIMVACA